MEYFKYSISILLLYFLIFYSPLFPIIGKNLIYEDKEFDNKNIIAFVGNGEPQYNNLSYRKRANEILEYYDSKLTKTITFKIIKQ